MKIQNYDVKDEENNDYSRAIALARQRSSIAKEIW